MHVTLPGDVWLELDGKRVTVEDARRLAGVLVDVATAAETLQRHNAPQALTGQDEALGQVPVGPAESPGQAAGPHPDDPGPAPGQAKTTGPVRVVGKWPDDRGRDELPRHSGQPSGRPEPGGATQSGT